MKKLLFLLSCRFSPEVFLRLINYHKKFFCFCRAKNIKTTCKKIKISTKPSKIKKRLPKEPFPSSKYKLEIIFELNRSRVACVVTTDTGVIIQADI